MNRSKNTKTMLLPGIFLLLFYFGIMMYILFEIVHISLLPNFAVGIVFELIGFLLLLAAVFSKLLAKPLAAGYFIPLVIVAAAYTILLNVMNTIVIVLLPFSFFLLLHLILLFVYCLLSIPMFIMGKR